MDVISIAMHRNYNVIRINWKGRRAKENSEGAGASRVADDDKEREKVSSEAIEADLRT